MDGLGALRPLLEWPERRTAEGKERNRAEFARETLDDAAAPAVERIASAVPSLGRSGEGGPTLAPGETGEYDCANFSKLVALLVLSEKERAARDEARLHDG
jgi:hypothetical protein